MTANAIYVGTFRVEFLIGPDQTRWVDLDSFCVQTGLNKASFLALHKEPEWVDSFHAAEMIDAGTESFVVMRLESVPMLLLTIKVDRQSPEAGLQLFRLQEKMSGVLMRNSKLGPMILELGQELGFIEDVTKH